MRPIRGLAIMAAAILAAGLVPATTAAAATAPQWHETSADPGRQVTGNATTVSPDGSTVFVTGTATSAADTGFGLTIAYSAATGAVLWKAKFDPNAGKDDSGFSSIAVSPDGSTVFVSGHSGDIGDPGGLVQAVVAYNAATGAELWQAIGTVSAGVGPGPLVVSPDGTTVFVTSASVGFTGQTSAYAAATGTQLWTEPAGGDAIALDASASALYVSGERIGSTQPGSEAFNSLTGATIWQASQSGTNVQIKAASLSPDGSVLFADGTSTSGKKAIGFAAAYSASSGAPLWTVTTGGAGTSVDGLAVTPSGSVIVSEWINVASAAIRWVTRALDPATGATLWNRTRNFSSQGPATFASALALSPDGSTAYVAGYSDRWEIIGYGTADGTQVWSATYHGQADNFAYAIAVSGSQVVVTGTSNQGPPIHDVMATAAFPTS
jgi:outer membrane protein assembly factor BamB